MCSRVVVNMLTEVWMRVCVVFGVLSDVMLGVAFDW